MMEKKTKNQKPKKRIRLSPQERREMILRGAITYFGKHGFDGRTRELAEYLGISQALLYRYFPSTESLLDSIYEIIFLSRWNDDWQTLICDQNIPIKKRLIDFYKDYNSYVDRYDVIRITIFSALRGENISQRYFNRILNLLLWPMIIELRKQYKLPNIDEQPIHPLEEEIILSLHSVIIYRVIRKHIMGSKVVDASDFLIELFVNNFMAGAEESFRQVFKQISSPQE